MWSLSGTASGLFSGDNSRLSLVLRMSPTEPFTIAGAVFLLAWCTVCHRHCQSTEGIRTRNGKGANIRYSPLDSQEWCLTVWVTLPVYRYTTVAHSIALFFCNGVFLSREFLHLWSFSDSGLLLCLRPHRAEALSDAFVWRLSVTYIGPNLRTERPRKTKIGTEVTYVTRDSITTFKVKRSKVNLLLMS